MTKLEPESSVKASSNATTFKRPPSPSLNTSVNKKIKGILKNNSQPVAQAKSSLPADFFDNNTKQVNGELSSAIQKSENKDSTANITDVQSIEIEEEKEKEKEKVKDMNVSVLPEGFFDDPIMDAKVRNVEYKDPIEEEWEKFQKAIKEETAQSAQIIADDQEEATTERQLDEIEEQIRHWSRVMDLVKRKEQVQATDRKQENVDENMSSGDETEFDEFLDWRAKNSYK
ncbi:Zinc finger protein 830 [Harpegnathos saltator]|uniref:Zinc finger protein 830 n=2 Tax=Harpegnathos saltator TaxID=610380 RepID=E2BFQ6_HARSA|nr:Zinc finger protein 830 [Harpegnathos saltator]